MKNFPILIFIFIFTSCLTQTEEANVAEKEIAVLFTSSGNRILKTGSHQVSNRDVLVTVQQRDSTKLKTFDVLDANAQSLMCSVTVKYTINNEQLSGIADFLTYPDHVEDYKALVTVPQLRSSLRELCFSHKKEDLMKNNKETLELLKELTTKRLSSFISIEELQIRFFE